MHLPVELIQHVFSFLSPCEVVRLRQVSKQFLDVTHSYALWREIYSNVPLLLPPGPLSSRSPQHLERTLVRSELVSKTWTSQPLKPLSHTLTSWKREYDDSWIVVSGRWCIFLQGKIIQCHDIDTNTYHSLYDGTAHPEFRFMAATATSINGKRIYLLLVDYIHPHELVKLLEFLVDDESLSGPEIMDWEHVGTHSFSIWPSTVDFHGSTPFILVRHHEPCVVFDCRTRRLYKLLSPKLLDDLMNDFQPPLLQPEYNTSTRVILTRTHIIAIHVYGHFPDMHTLIQAFVPSDSEILGNGADFAQLRLTHEAIIRTTSHPLSLLRNSVVDPVTGSVSIRLLHTTFAVRGDGHRSQMSCLHLTLPKPVSTTDIQSISIRSQHLLESTWTDERYTASDDGHARGLLLTNSGPPHFRSFAARKFAIDASGEECIVESSDPRPIDLPSNEENVAFDGTRGRIHYFQVEENENQVITVDLA